MRLYLVPERALSRLQCSSPQTATNVNPAARLDRPLWDLWSKSCFILRWFFVLGHISDQDRASPRVSGRAFERSYGETHTKTHGRCHAFAIFCRHFCQHCSLVLYGDWSVLLPALGWSIVSLHENRWLGSNPLSPISGSLFSAYTPKSRQEFNCSRSLSRCRSKYEFYKLQQHFDNIAFKFFSEIASFKKNNTC